MTTAQESPVPPSSTSAASALARARVLVVQVRPSSALGMGAAVARAGARVNVCRCAKAALGLLDSVRGEFDAVAFDGELDRATLMALGAAIRTATKPTLAIGIGSPRDPASIRRLVEAGVIELVVPPLSPEAIVDALGRCVLATAEMRNLLADARSQGEPAERRPAHWGPGSVKPVPRHNPDIEDAVARHARSARLSPRETSVLKYIALGYRYDEIGEALAISGRTVKMHAANVRRKVGAPDRLALVRKVLSR